MDNQELNEKMIIYDDAVTKVADGNIEYMTVLYNELKRDIFLLAYSITGNYHLSEEILQETFICVQTKADTYCKGTNAKAWILTIVKNLSYKTLSKRKNELSISEIEDIRCDESLEEKIESILDLESLLSNLTEEERQIVILHDCSGLKHREIACIMNLSAVNVRKKYTRILEKLHMYLKRSEKNVF